MKTLFSIALATAGMVAAGQITYTVSDTGSGSLVLASIQNFTNATITFTEVTDTSLITSCGVGTYCAPNATNTVSISGIGTFTLNDSTHIFDNQSTSVAGIEDPSSSDLLDEKDSAFSTYAMQTSLGPITDNLTLTTAITNLLTSGGQLSATWGPNVTFTAITTPEPGSMALILTGALPLGLLALRRRRA
jgi:hypothetical protein